MRNKALFGVLFILTTVKLSINCSLITTPLVKNTIISGTVHNGEIANYYFDPSNPLNPLLHDKSTPKAFNLYLTLSICTLPASTKQLKPLDLYISQTDSTPGPDTIQVDKSDLKFKKEVGLEYVRLVVEGITPSTKNLYLSVHAPKLESSSSEENFWQYELSASVTGFMENQSSTTVILHDTDHNTAAFSAIQSSKKQTVLKAYVLPENETSTWMPLCMLSKKSLKSFHVKRDVAQEVVRFHVDNLEVNSKYRIFYTEESTGHTQYRRITNSVSFGTAQAESNCRVIQPTKFCTDVNYSVPSPNNITDQKVLTERYDAFANERYQSFEDALKRFDCSTVYSPLRTCDDCRKAYKTWICAITIPRCATGTPPGGEAPGLQFRNDNPTYSVGPFTLNDTNAFMEYLPCLDLCWDVVRSCPAFFQFSCPSKDPSNVDYGVTPNCNTLSILPPSQGFNLSVSPLYLLGLLLTYIVTYRQWF
ncbi:centractin- actin- protein of the dynactin complex [Basidiobolus ranarum]|uniref:Centractin- actin- protein of the dynactin complex n=1 Tax=Basidiobolus ranarum TaxID=34480 RepID=A0ABR2WB94_9FUNG